MAIKCIVDYLVRCENGEGEFASREESVRGSDPKKVSALLHSFLLFLSISLMESSDSDPATAEERALGRVIQGA